MRERDSEEVHRVFTIEHNSRSNVKDVEARGVVKGLDLSSRRYGFSGLFLFLLGFALMGWTHYLVTDIISLLVGYALMFTSGHYHLKKAESRTNRP